MERIGFASFPLADLIAVLGRPRVQDLWASPHGIPSVALWGCGCSAEQDGSARDFAWCPCEVHQTRRADRPAV